MKATHNVLFDATVKNRLLFPAVRDIKGSLCGGLSIDYKTRKARLKCYNKYWAGKQLSTFRLFLN